MDYLVKGNLNIFDFRQVLSVPVVSASGLNPHLVHSRSCQKIHNRCYILTDRANVRLQDFLIKV